jgi:hypothetical protein
MSPKSVNCFTSAAKFIYQTTLELPWSDGNFVRTRVATLAATPRFFPRRTDVNFISHKPAKSIFPGTTPTCSTTSPTQY